MKKSFTLLELLISLVILGVLSALITGNFITSLKKGRDARRKADLEQIQRALEMYYEDKRSYPNFNFNFGKKLCETKTDDNCGVEKVYMQKIPNDPNPSYTYQYISDGTYYLLFSCIENNLDQGPGVNQTGYAETNCGACGACKYGIASSNTSLP